MLNVCMLHTMDFKILVEFELSVDLFMVGKHFGICAQVQNGIVLIYICKFCK